MRKAWCKLKLAVNLRHALNLGQGLCPRPKVSQCPHLKFSPLIKIGPAHSRKRIVAAPAANLSPIQASPPATPSGKENANVRTPHSGHRSNRKPFGNANNRENIAQPQFVKPVDQPKRRSRVLGDSTARYANDENVDKPKKMKEVKSKEKINHVKQRVRDWEIERQRLRELQRLEELEREQEEADEEQELEQEPEPEPEQERRLIPPSIVLQTPRIPSAPSSGTFLQLMH